MNTSQRSIRSFVSLLVGMLYWFAIASCFAADTSDSVTIVPHWKKGEKVAYEIVRTTVRIKDGKRGPKAASHCDLNVEVLDVTKEMV